MHISRTGSVGTGATLDAKEMRPRARSEIEARQSRASEMRARCEVAGSYCGELTDERYLNPVLYEAFFFLSRRMRDIGSSCLRNLSYPFLVLTLDL